MYNNHNWAARRSHAGRRETFVQQTIHTGQQTNQVVDPPAPMMLTVPLPRVDEEHVSATTTVAATNPIQGSLGTHSARSPQPWTINSALEYQTLPWRPVVPPILSDMPAYTGHMWGARYPPMVEGSGGGKTVHFVDSAEPATNPPIVRLRLETPCQTRLIVCPRVGNQFVSIGDVQRTVITWMRDVERIRTYGQEEGPGLTQRKLVGARVGTTLEVEVWVWKGLIKVEGKMDLWAIKL